MNEEIRDSSRDFNVDKIAAVALSILLVLTFAAELLFWRDDISGLEQGLFNLPQVLVSVGFSWFLTRALTKREFEASLKRFALSAYRRVRDINRLVSRIQSEIARMRPKYPSDRTHELDLVRIMAEDIADTVRSSIADWADVIGDELQKEHRLFELRSEYAQRQLSATTGGKDSERDPALQELREEISRLRSEIPYVMGFEAKPITEFEAPDVIVQMLSAELDENGEITVYARGYRDSFESDWAGLEEGDILFLHPSYAIHSFEFIVLRREPGSAEFQAIGQLTNPYGRIGVDEIEYHMALSGIMGENKVYLDQATDGFPVAYVSPSQSRGDRFSLRYSPDLRPEQVQE